MSDNQFGCRVDFECGEGKSALYSLEKLQKDGIGPVDSLPFSIRILLEQALRNVGVNRFLGLDAIRLLLLYLFFF